MERMDDYIEEVLDLGTTAMRDNDATPEQIEDAEARIFRNLRDERYKKKVAIDWLPSRDVRLIEG